jgi:hypothetical protein
MPARGATATAGLRRRQLLEPRSKCVPARGATAAAIALARTRSFIGRQLSPTFLAQQLN